MTDLIHSSTAHQRQADVRTTATRAKTDLERSQQLLTAAREADDAAVLGYPSWTAYLADSLGGSPLRLAIEQRREIVGYLSGEGMSTRAIAPIVGADQATIVRDLRPIADASPAARDVVELSGPRAVTGLDGKTYTPRQLDAMRPPPIPPDPEVVRARELREVAEDAVRDFALAINGLGVLTVSEGRTRVVEQWTAGEAAVSPAMRERVYPVRFRQIADGLALLADEWELTHG